jgi:acyl-CoA reductase-like NAD-dependent aldehyde dehydrogenase
MTTLRDQAIEAAQDAIAENARQNGWRLAGAAAVAASEPFLRAQVIAEVVEALRAAPHGHRVGDPQDPSWALHGREWFADFIEHEFGG